ncbi:MAG: class I SAM-dependent methyltransferase [Rhodospirillales bacterium]|jgi:predicted O-methyltransferase YrrM|nr:class I SAM-dependent methyltransferase [Rhodospirillales bacterium]
MTMGARLRNLGMGIATVCGFRRQGYFIPHRLADKLPEPGANLRYEELGGMLAAALPSMRRVLEMIEAVGPQLAGLGQEPPPAPRWGQSWFPRLDGAAAYALVDHHKPNRILEVGSGHSTRFLAHAVRDGGLETEITSIDPAPRRKLDGLGVHHIAKPLQEAGDVARGLAEGDFLFIDSSHILMPGSDVDFILNRLLPSLPVGVLIHFHDIFLPDDYPARWGWRSYNEQQGVAALLQGGGYDVLFASHFANQALVREIAGSVLSGIELTEDGFESSLWLRKAHL